MAIMSTLAEFQTNRSTSSRRKLKYLGPNMSNRILAWQKHGKFGYANMGGV